MTSLLKSRANPTKSKQLVRTSLPNCKQLNSTNSAQSTGTKQDNSIGANGTEEPEEFEMSIDHMGALNMTKCTSKIKSFNVLVAVTGSVAAIKLIELIKKLRLAFPRSFTSRENNQTYKATIAIKVVMTENSKHFIPKEEIQKQINSLLVEVLDDTDEWSQWNKMGDPVLHIELRKWADLCLIAPLDANTMAKLSNGVCDNLLTCTVRAWDTTKPLIYCPAMNVHMYEHPITHEQLNRLQSFGYQRVDSIQKRLACGDFGMGAMAAVDTIVDRVVDALVGSGPKPNLLLRPQQPTYPLMPATSTSSSFLDRIKVANHNAIRSINNQRYSTASVNAIDLNRSTNLQSSLYQHQLPPDGDYILDSDQDDNDQFGGGQFSNISATDIVTSVQNLKAINFSPQLGEEYDLEDIEEEKYNAGDRDDQHKGVKAPVTDSLIESGHPRLRQTPSRANRVSATPKSVSSAARTKGPAVDPAAVLSSCYNKSRNCFTCIICKNDYKNRKSMSRHLKEQHLQGNIHRCSPCGVSYKRREKLIKHNREHHGGLPADARADGAAARAKEK